MIAEFKQRGSVSATLLEKYEGRLPAGHLKKARLRGQIAPMGLACKTNGGGFVCISEKRESH